MTVEGLQEDLRRCFVCSALVDRRHLDEVLSPLACPTCTRRARLVSSGALLADVLRGTPCESGLNVLVNPVTIDSHRGWADCCVGGFAVFGERHASSDYFDVVAQHTRRGRLALRPFASAHLGAEPSIHDLFRLGEALAAEDRRPFWEALAHLDFVWQWCRRTEAALSSFAPLRSGTDVMKAYEVYVATPEPPVDAAACWRRLAALARAHGPADATSNNA